MRMDREEIDGKPFDLVGVFVFPHERTRERVRWGLAVQGREPDPVEEVASFVEVYGRRIPVEDIPKVKVTFGNLMVNGKPVKVRLRTPSTQESPRLRRGRWEGRGRDCHGRAAGKERKAERAADREVKWLAHLHRKNRFLSCADTSLSSVWPERAQASFGPDRSAYLFAPQRWWWR